MNGPKSSSFWIYFIGSNMEFLVNWPPRLPRDARRTPKTGSSLRAERTSAQARGLTKGTEAWQQQPPPGTSGVSQHVRSPFLPAAPSRAQGSALARALTHRSHPPF